MRHDHIRRGKNIAFTLRTNLDWCAEFKKGYVFSSVYDEGYVGGLDHSPIVVLKSTGEIVTHDAVRELRDRENAKRVSA